jgi:hypothetical protein
VFLVVFHVFIQLVLSTALKNLHRTIIHSFDDGVVLVAQLIYIYSVALSNKQSGRCRERTQRPEHWLWNKVRAAVVSGTIHVNEQKKVIPERQRKYINCKCKFNSTSHITLQRQAILYQEYRAMPNRVDLCAFLSSLIIEEPIQRCTVHIHKNYRFSTSQ